MILRHAPSSISSSSSSSLSSPSSAASVVVVVMSQILMPASQDVVAMVRSGACFSSTRPRIDRQEYSVKMPTTVLVCMFHTTNSQLSHEAQTTQPLLNSHKIEIE